MEELEAVDDPRERQDRQELEERNQHTRQELEERRQEEEERKQQEHERQAPREAEERRRQREQRVRRGAEPALPTAGLWRDCRVTDLYCKLCSRDCRAGRNRGLQVEGGLRRQRKYRERIQGSYAR